MKNYVNKMTAGNVALLEINVKAPSLSIVYHKIFNWWCFTSNSSFHRNGRIILAWKPASFNVIIVKGSSQLLHCYLEPTRGNHGFYCTFINAINDIGQRRELWQELMQFQINEPWTLSGEFNCVMNTDERIGATVRGIEFRDIRDCMSVCGMKDVKSIGHLLLRTTNKRDLIEYFPS